MRIDLYTKIVLTMMALALTLIVCKSVIQPNGVAAKGPFAAVEFSGSMGGFWAFDTRTGDIWVYDGCTGKTAGHSKMTKLGQPLQQFK